MQPAPEHRATYGFVEESVGTVTVRGRGAHNPNSEHSINVWNENGLLKVYLSARPMVIALHPLEQPPRLGEVHCGDRLALVHADGTTREYQVTSRWLSDPDLVLICPQCDELTTGPHIQGCPLDPAQFELAD